MPDFTITPLRKEGRDEVLGEYMDAFSRMEQMLQMAIQSLLNIPHESARPIFATLMTKQSVELLEAAAKTKLSPNDADRVTHLCGRIGKRNMRRNHIVHGYWTHFIKETPDGRTDGEWVRVYENVDPALARLNLDDPKLLGVYTFTIPALERATGHVEEMVQALSVLVLDIPNQLARQQTPEAQFQTWVAVRQAPSGGVALRLSQYRVP